MLKRNLVAACITGVCAIANPATAQNWTFSGSVQYQTFHGTLSAPGLEFSLSCLGQYPGADPFYIEGDVVNDPYSFGLYVGAAGLVANTQVNRYPARIDLNVLVDGRALPIAPAFSNEMLGAGLYSEISLLDPIMDTLIRTGSGFDLRAGATPLGSASGDGLTSAMPEFLSFCDGHWRALGHAPNTAQQAILTQASRPTTPQPTATPTVQTWSVGTTDTGGLIYGGVSAPEYSISFGCNAPSQGGRPLHETDDHETILDGLFGMSMEVSPRLVQSQGAADVMATAILMVDGTGYRLPPIEWSEFISSWRVALAMDDPLFDALRDASDLVFDAGRGTAWRYPVDGLEQGIDRAMGPCVDGWAAAGHTIPVSLSRFWDEGMEELPLEGGISSPIIARTSTPTPVAATIPAFIQGAASSACSAAGYTLDASRLQTADLDGDGLEDYLLNHSGVRCNSGINGNCGAANCSIDAFLSTQGYQLRQAFLGMGAGLVPLPDGRTGIQISGTYSMCGETGFCPGPQVWNGSEFALLQPDGPPPTTPLVPPQFILDRVAAGCSASGYSLDIATTIGQADFDQDGQLDFIFNGLGVNCTQGLNPFCGASACSIDIHLSSRGYAIVDGYIGVGFDIQTAADGRPGIVLNRSATQPLSVWDGTAFVPAPGG